MLQVILVAAGAGTTAITHLNLRACLSTQCTCAEVTNCESLKLTRWLNRAQRESEEEEILVPRWFELRTTMSPLPRLSGLLAAFPAGFRHACVPTPVSQFLKRNLLVCE